MKLEYVKPELEEIELVLEGSFQDVNTQTHEGVVKGEEEWEGDDWG